MILMEIQVDKLREAMQLLQPVVPKKPTLAVLKNILLGNGKAIASNLDVIVLVDLPGADTNCLLPFRQIQELIKYLPGRHMLTIALENHSLKIAWEGGNASFQSGDADDYPPVPEMQVKVEGAIDGDLLVKTLREVIDYCASDEKRPVLRGVLISLGDNTVVTAADGFRLAYQELPIPFPAQEKMIIPVETVGILEHLWQKSPPPLPDRGDSLISKIVGKREIQASLGKGILSAHFGKITLFAKLLEGTYPNVAQLIPTAPPLKVQVFADELNRALHRIKNISKHGAGAARLSWDDTTMTVSARDGDDGNIETKFDVRAEGGPGKTAVQTSYLLEYLKGKEGTVDISVTDESSPVLLRYGRAPVVVIMPMQVQA
jgi:DNA polymerase-3 subunit beta